VSRAFLRVLEAVRTHLWLALRTGPRTGRNAKPRSREVAKESVPFFAPLRLGGSCRAELKRRRVALNSSRQRRRVWIAIVSERPVAAQGKRPTVA